MRFNKCHRAKRRFHSVACALSRFMITLKDSSRPPCPPFSSLSSSPAWPTPRAAWLCLCSSSWRLSSSAARVLPWNQFTQTHTQLMQRSTWLLIMLWILGKAEGELNACCIVLSVAVCVTSSLANLSDL